MTSQINLSYSGGVTLLGYKKAILSASGEMSDDHRVYLF